MRIIYILYTAARLNINYGDHLEVSEQTKHDTRLKEKKNERKKEKNNNNMREKNVKLKFY